MLRNSRQAMLRGVPDRPLKKANWRPGSGVVSLQVLRVWTMKIGIDSYCYHRFFGEIYPQQTPPARRMTVEDFVIRAHELGVDGVSLEACFFPDYSSEYLSQVRGLLDKYNLDRVYAWGHPDGLEGGANREAYRDMIASFDRAEQI